MQYTLLKDGDSFEQRGRQRVWSSFDSLRVILVTGYLIIILYGLMEKNEAP